MILKYPDKSEIIEVLKRIANIQEGIIADFVDVIKEQQKIINKEIENKKVKYINKWIGRY